MWDDWHAIEAAQAKADAADAERRQHRLRVVPDQPAEPAHDALRATETAPGLVAATPGPPDIAPRMSATDPRNPDRPPVDPVAGIRLYAKQLRDHLADEEDTDG